MTIDRFQIRAMRDGGFIVLAGGELDRGYGADPVFACALIDDALRYVRDRLQKKADA